MDDAKKSQSSVTALKIDNVGGVFVVLIGGLSLAFLVAICEFLCDSRKMSVQSCDSICEEMVSDLKFSLKCHSKTKPNREKSASLQLALPMGYAVAGGHGPVAAGPGTRGVMSHHSSNDSSMYLQPVHHLQPQSLNNSTYLASYLGLPRHQQIVPQPSAIQPQAMLGQGAGGGGGLTQQQQMYNHQNGGHGNGGLSSMS